MSADTPRKIVIFGTSGLGQVMQELLLSDPARRAVAFTVDRRFVSGPQFSGLPLYPFEDIEAHCPPSGHAMLIAVGQMDRNRLRARVFADLLARGYQVESFIDPSVKLYPSNRIGRGCVIYDGVSIQPYAQLGDNVVIRPLAYVGHHSTIESHCFIAPHAAILGQCTIGALSVIAANATIFSRVTIGPGSVISAGAVVTGDLPASSIVRANPKP